MNPITYALNQVHFRIPDEVLKETFVSRQFNFQFRSTPATIDARIRDLVLNARVMVDCNLFGGVETTIPLIRASYEYIDPYQVIYTVPKTLTQGRSITRALSVSFGDGAMAGITNLVPSYGNNLLDAAQGLLQSHQPIPMVSTANCILVGENQVLIQDNFTLPPNIYLRCWLENDAMMSHIQPTSYPAFAELVVLAVKAYIYMNLQIPMDKGVIHAGADLGRFREVVDGYSDADEQYRDHLKKVWRKVAYLNDFQAHRRHIQRLLGGPN